MLSIAGPFPAIMANSRTTDPDPNPRDPGTNQKPTLWQEHDLVNFNADDDDDDDNDDPQPRDSGC
jgi:hypothetical protein